MQQLSILFDASKQLLNSFADIISLYIQWRGGRPGGSLLQVMRRFLLCIDVVFDCVRWIIVYTSVSSLSALSVDATGRDLRERARERERKSDSKRERNAYLHGGLRISVHSVLLY